MAYHGEWGKIHAQIMKDRHINLQGVTQDHLQFVSSGHLQRRFCVRGEWRAMPRGILNALVARRGKKRQPPAAAMSTKMPCVRSPMQMRDRSRIDALACNGDTLLHVKSTHYSLEVRRKGQNVLLSSFYEAGKYLLDSVETSEMVDPDLVEKLRICEDKNIALHHDVEKLRAQMQLLLNQCTKSKTDGPRTRRSRLEIDGMCMHKTLCKVQRFRSKGNQIKASADFQQCSCSECFFVSSD